MSDNPKLSPVTCPDPGLWREVAGGSADPERTLAYIDHASRCSHCGPRLREAVGELIDPNGELIDLDADLTDAERKQITSLESSRPEWQLKLAERITGRARPQPAPAPWWQRWLSVPSLAATGAAVALLAAVGFFVLAPKNDATSANNLLARAYTDKRPIELRFSGAAYAPFRGQKGADESVFQRSASLLKAEALIAAQSPSHRDDPAWLQADARANLLEDKYDAAVESLQRALELRPNSPDLLLDLGTAYFQRGRSEDRLEDFGSAYEDLSRVLVQQPDNTTALFNRAIVAEYEYLYQGAVDDWEHYLKLDSASQWAAEARSHLDTVRSKLKVHEPDSQLLSPEKLANAQNIDVGADVDQRVEQYLDAAVRSWLPQAYPDDGSRGDPQAQRALFFLADLTAQKHQDRWLSDLLQHASVPSFPRSIAAMARASQANDAGDFANAIVQSTLARQLFSESGNSAGVLRAQFEKAYSEQLTSRTNECRHDASTALAQSEQLSYSWLQVQLGLEKADCLFLGKNDWGADERLSRQAMEHANSAHYNGLYVRALYFVADNQVRHGDLAGGLKSVATALDRCWSAQIPANWVFNLYDLLGSTPEFIANRPYFAMGIWTEAAALVDPHGNLLMRAWAHSFAARSAAAVHQSETAARQYDEAANLFARAPRTDASRRYVLENEIFAAQLDVQLGQVESGVARLTRIQNQIQPGGDKYLEEMFYATLGELQLRGNHQVQAEQAFRPALESAEQRLGSLNSEAERINWSKEAATVYLGMAEAELSQGHAEESLEYFEWYLGAPGRAAEGDNGMRVRSTAPDSSWLSSQLASRLPLLTHQTVLAYAALPNGLAIWTCDNRGVNARWIPQSNQDLRELAARFYDLASDPKSEMPALQRDARSLYSVLIAPIETRLEPGRTLVIEADGWLAQVPFEALLDSNGHYLVEGATIVHSLGQSTDAAFHEDLPFSQDLPALVVGSAASSETQGLIPLPDIVAEADAVASDFPSHVVLTGPAPSLDAIESALPGVAVFHFTGHSVTGSNGSALLLAAARPQSSEPVLLAADQLRHLALRNLQLAVLSTCNTATGNDGSRGFNSIGEALQRAGVPHVVASRWAVDSGATREFVESFYHNVLSGQPVSEAVQQTSRAMLADRRTSHPYYWSAFSAYGRP